MRFMIIVKARGLGSGRHAARADVAEMAKYHEELQKAGVLLDASDSRPARKAGASSTPDRTHPGGRPFTEAKELIAGTR